MLKGKQVKLVPVEVDAFLAMKDVRGVGDEVGGTELSHDSCEGGSHRQEKGGKGDKGGKGTGFQGNFNCCGTCRRRLNEC